MLLVLSPLLLPAAADLGGGGGGGGHRGLWARAGAGGGRRTTMAESGGGEMREGVGAAGEGEERHRSNGDGADGGTRKPEGIKKCKGIMSLQKTHYLFEQKHQQTESVFNSSLPILCPWRKTGGTTTPAVLLLQVLHPAACGIREGRLAPSLP